MIDRTARTRLRSFLRKQVLKMPICVQCFNEAKAKLAEIEATFVPGYTNWARMIQGWVVDNPRPILTPCWSCAATLEGSTVADDRHWREVCTIKAVKLLSTVSFHDCVSWECENAVDQVAAIRKLMPKSLDGGDKKKQKTSVTPAAKKKGASECKGVSWEHSCVLCGTNCGEDHVGVSKSQPAEVGSVGFHKACRDKIWCFDVVEEYASQMRRQKVLAETNSGSS
jgi:hypothetical protein